MSDKNGTDKVRLSGRSVRLRVFLVFIIASGAIITAGLGIGAAMLTPGMQKTVNYDLELVANIADNLVSEEIRLLKTDTSRVALQLALSPEEDVMEILTSALTYYQSEFISLTVLDKKGVRSFVGNYPTSANLLEQPYLQLALNGEQVISTTRLEPDGMLTSHVCVPIDAEKVLSATVPGLYFQNILEGFKVWESGYIIIGDETGTILASGFPEWTEQRLNFLSVAESNPSYESAATVVKNMVSGETGLTYFTLGGQEQICAFRPISGSTIGWSLAVIAPTSESPLSDAYSGLLAVGVFCLLLSIVGGYMTARMVEKPYLEAQKNKREAERANEAKSSFLANMSHEMRTPLNAIIGLTELSLSAERMGDGLRDNIEKVYSSGVTLLSLINDILDLSKVEAGKLEIVPVEYDTPSLINDTATLNQVRIGSKPIKFIINVTPELYGHLYGDDLRVKQILNNLLSNAFKYTKQGSVTMSITTEKAGSDVWVTVTVTDTGIGIKPEHMPKLFTDYSQVDTKSNRRIEGTGLGLSLTKRMAELMGGTVSATSEFGVGSTFTARFKQGYVSEAIIGPEIAAQLRAIQYAEHRHDRSSRLVRVKIPYARVLVVDDVQTNLDVAKGLMKPYQMQIDCVMSGQEAIDLIEAGEPHYDAIFMDHMMPDMDGVEATRYIRAKIDSEYARSIPIIALTANALVGSEEMFLNNGFQALIAKPIDIMRLDTMIGQYVRNKEREKEISLQEASGTLERRQGNDRRSSKDRRCLPDRRSGFDRRNVPRQHIEGIDLIAGLERFGGDVESYWEVIESYVLNTPALLDKLNECLESDRMQDYGITVHGVKGSSRAICANDVGEVAEELERAAKAGNLEYVRSRHRFFIDRVQQLVDGLTEMLEKEVSPPSKPSLECPDRETLMQLLGAAEVFDIDGVDEAMLELESYEYEQNGELVDWLREQISIMGFKKIVERLKSLDEEGDNNDSRQQ